ncbi:MAG TPA: YCF48-related protein, partial [Acidimicrobiales bacterium]|nr:YCF48-related protein [Acidimicrobiales bacterium]
MSRRRAALLTLALGLVTTLPTAPGSAQEAAPARLTITPQSIDFGSILFGVSFADSLHGHAVGAYHSIFGTADGGQTWARKDNPLPTRNPRTATAGVVDPRDQALISVSFPDPGHGFAVATDDAVLATSDGGTTWALRPTPRPASLRVAWPEDVPPSAWNFTGVSFPTATSGFVVGHLGVILATADGGTTWRHQGDPRYGVLQGVSFLDERNGHAVGRASGRADGVHYTSLVTTDGQRWDPTAAGPADGRVVVDSMTAVAVTTPNHAVTVGHGERIFATFDGGK